MGETNPPLLTLEHVHRRFAGATEAVLSDVSFSVGSREIFVLVGPSGCGKSTTLRLIAGLDRPDGGRVALQGRTLAGPYACVPPEKRGVGLVFQDYALFPHLNVLRNVMFGLRGMNRRERRRCAERTLARVGMESHAHRNPHELSGGQQQRVALARALAPAPSLILLDEPLSNLDPDLRRAMRAQLREVVKESGVSLLLVTHDQEEALSTGDRLALLAHGAIQQEGPPEELYRSPDNTCTARFLGGTNLLPAEAEGGASADTPLGTLPLTRPAYGPLTVSVRPEQLGLVPNPCETDARAVVLAREFKGHDLTYRIAVGERELVAQTMTHQDLTPDSAVGVRVEGPVTPLEAQRAPESSREEVPARNGSATC